MVLACHCVPATLLCSHEHTCGCATIGIKELPNEDPNRDGYQSNGYHRTYTGLVQLGSQVVKYKGS
jgi:hypothetical protein